MADAVAFESLPCCWAMPTILSSSLDGFGLQSFLERTHKTDFLAIEQCGLSSKHNMTSGTASAAEHIAGQPPALLFLPLRLKQHSLAWTMR